MTRDELIKSLVHWLASINLPHPTRVAIDGVDAAGKTILANELVQPLARLGRRVIRASVDGFHQPASHRYERGALSPEGYYLDSYDYDALRSQLLLPLGPHGNLRYRTAIYDYRADVRLKEPSRIASPDAILVFDGIFLLRPEINDCWDARIFVSVPLNVSLERGVARDSKSVVAVAEVQQRYEHRYIPAQRHYLESVRAGQIADAVVDNTEPCAPRLLLSTRDRARDRKA
jgi:uridine kinase